MVEAESECGWTAMSFATSDQVLLSYHQKPFNSEKNTLPNDVGSEGQKEGCINHSWSSRLQSLLSNMIE